MTTTSSHIISPPFAEDVQLLLNVPKHKPILGHRNKVAISVFIAPPGTANVPIGCYIYGLYDVSTIITTLHNRTPTNSYTTRYEEARSTRQPSTIARSPCST